VAEYTIMIVDDDMTNRELLQTVFQRVGYAVIHASNGQQAIRLAESEQPSLVVCDVRMSGMDGYQVCAQIKGNPATKHIPIVMLTAFETEEERQKALQAGADDFSPKMQGWQRLLERVKRLLPA
jgi:CheY-like chemotaxis protein